MFYYLYKITNTVNNKIYIGVHQTKDMNDGYFGSGTNLRRAIKKYGKDKFIKEILEYFENEESMLAREKEVVNEDFVKSATTYNINVGGRGSFSYINSLPNQNHKPGQQKDASVRGHQAMRQKRLDDTFVQQFSKKISTIVKEQYRNGKRVNPATWHKWVSNNYLQVSKYVPADSINELVNQGWVLGRKFKKQKQPENKI